MVNIDRVREYCDINECEVVAIRIDKIFEPTKYMMSIKSKKTGKAKVFELLDNTINYEDVVVDIVKHVNTPDEVMNETTRKIAKGGINVDVNVDTAALERIVFGCRLYDALTYKHQAERINLDSIISYCKDLDSIDINAAALLDLIKQANPHSKGTAVRFI